MDNADVRFLIQGAATLGVDLTPFSAEQLLKFRDELLKWNRKINLTAITDPREILEKHFLDSLVPVPECRGVRRLLDIGAGAGLPGIPLKLVLPALELVMVDSVAKKVGFQKQALATLGLSGARALHLHAAGKPTAEGIPLSDAVICRALMPLEEWVPAAAPYLSEHGKVIAMLSAPPADSSLEALRAAHGFLRAGVRTVELPNSRAPRTVVELIR